jgi:hypothetical protein
MKIITVIVCILASFLGNCAYDLAVKRQVRWKLNLLISVPIGTLVGLL